MILEDQMITVDVFLDASFVIDNVIDDTYHVIDDACDVLDDEHHARDDMMIQSIDRSDVSSDTSAQATTMVVHSSLLRVFDCHRAQEMPFFEALMMSKHTRIERSL